MTLKRQSEFKRLFQQGRRFRPCEWLVINYLCTSESAIRFGWTLPRQVGNAAIRNRLKRWCREYFRTKISQTNRAPHAKVNLVFRPQPAEFYKKLSYKQLQSPLEKVWQKLSECQPTS